MMVKTTVSKVVLLCLLFLALLPQSTDAQTNQCPTCWVPIARHRLVTNVNISANIHGYGELLPKNYNPNSTQKHPLIINMHGRGGAGPGNDPYWICLAVCEGLPLKIEQGVVNDFETVNGQPVSYIVLTPNYQLPNANWNDIVNMLNYALANYPKVDRNKVYLTGNSQGSSMIMDLMSSSATNARRFAAVVPLATCNSQTSSGINNMISNNVHYWGLTAVQDWTCNPANTISWGNAMVNNAPHLGRLTVTPVYNPNFNHDIARVWESSWTDNGTTIVRWMLQYSSAAGGALPATLGEYDISLRNQQVVANWTTTLESNTDYFIIERAGADQQFKEIGRVQAAGNSSETNKYVFTDNVLLKGTSYYRVVLVNLDGVKEVYELRKITNKDFKTAIAVSPIPATTTIQLAFELETSQRLNFFIKDINGRTLNTWSANFSSGYASLPINIQG
ncbi:MAG: hypothetical protein H7Y31_05845, partial [Chitinophagaceae bacterium]|nr:hypothetical protein [Chitinophagaceae bacterium]